MRLTILAALNCGDLSDINHNIIPVTAPVKRLNKTRNPSGIFMYHLKIFFIINSKYQNIELDSIYYTIPILKTEIHEGNILIDPCIEGTCWATEELMLTLHTQRGMRYSRSLAIVVLVNDSCIYFPHLASFSIGPPGCLLFPYLYYCLCRCYVHNNTECRKAIFQPFFMNLSHDSNNVSDEKSTINKEQLQGILYIASFQK